MPPIQYTDGNSQFKRAPKPAVQRLSTHGMHVGIVCLAAHHFMCYSRNTVHKVTSEFAERVFLDTSANPAKHIN